MSCPTQREVDRVWRRLLRGGRASQRGWLVDRYGLSWQVIPRRLAELLGDRDPDGAARALAAMRKMQKIDVPTLERAAAGR